MNSATLEEAIEMIKGLSHAERQQLTTWLLAQENEERLSDFSYLTSHSVLEKEWLNEEEDKAWESL